MFADPHLEREGTNKKSNSWKTTSLSCAIRRRHHCNYEKSHLGSTVSFIQKQLQKYNIRDVFRANILNQTNNTTLEGIILYEHNIL